MYKYTVNICQVVLFVFANIASGSPINPEANNPTCTVCHPVVDGKINVHLVPHSHDDVGWLKTYDQYYLGTSPYNSYANASVERIISSTVKALKRNPNRRFIQVESAFLWLWWQHQTEETQDEVRHLLNTGQLEIINGGWSMNDEAAAHYQSIIDQYTLGFRFLDEYVGVCARAKVGWQIDPFGHSRQHASINKDLGFLGLVLGRIDYRDKNKRRLDQNLDSLWTSSANSDQSDIFTTILPGATYLSEEGFNFDITFKNVEQINDDLRSPQYNLNRKVNEFIAKIEPFRKYYKTSNMLLPMGGDFTFQLAESYFSNIDRLIKGFQNHSTFNVFYSTPSCYIKAVNDEIVAKNIKLHKKTDDFFPYASDAHAYWTGYFTSRPTSKRYERLGNNILQSAKQLGSFAKVVGGEYEKSLDSLKQAMGIMQHHDAISGTEKQAVANDYYKRLTIGIRDAERPIGEIIGNLLKRNSQSTVNLHLESCLLANLSVCDPTINDKFLVVIQNPLAWTVTQYIKIPVDGTTFTITGPNGREEYDVFDRMAGVDYLQGHRIREKTLIFAAKDIPPLGLQLYYVEKSTATREIHETMADDNSFGTTNTGFTLDTKTGLLNSITVNGKALKITQQFYYYQGVSSDKERSSGAYVFRPVPGTKAEPLTNQTVQIKVKRGKLVDEVNQKINSELEQIIRVYKNPEESYIEFDWLAGNLQFINGQGKEIVSRYMVEDLQNKGIFYTDSNGRELLRRELNKRSDYNLTREEPISSNYYPVASRLILRDEAKKIQVAVLNDRSQGGTSLTDGTLELMIHRRLPHDDDFGVQEALNEQRFGKGLYARGEHYLTFGNFDNQPRYERILERKKLLQPWLLFTNAATPTLNTLEKVQGLVKFQFSGLTRPLPPNVHILTLEPWKEETLLLRLEHILEQNEDSNLSKPVTVDLRELFSMFTVTKIEETTLGANQLKEDFQKESKLIWNGEEQSDEPVAKDPGAIVLRPTQIRTFILTIKS